MPTTRLSDERPERNQVPGVCEGPRQGPTLVWAVMRVSHACVITGGQERPLGHHEFSRIKHLGPQPDGCGPKETMAIGADELRAILNHQGSERSI